jgi:hypothetical protein
MAAKRDTTPLEAEPRASNLKMLHLDSPFLAWLFDHTCCRYFGNRP